MEVMMNRLVKIRDECLPENEKQGDKSKEKKDPFTAAKDKITGELRDIRSMIKERDAVEAENPGSKYAVELAHNCRMAIGAVQEDFDRMAASQKAKQAKYDKSKKKSEQIDQQMQLRTDVIDVIQKHVDECMFLEKKRYGGGPMRSSTKVADPTVTELPPIDDPRFQQLMLNDKKIDELLAVVGKNVKDLGEIAKEMGSEIKAQGKQLDELEVAVDKTNKKMEDINVRLKNILEKARPGNKFMIDFILIVILLGLGGLIYTIIQARW